ncbi:hypothetical protein COOONC_04936 [Cooperia oncophora]
MTGQRKDSVREAVPTVGLPTAALKILRESILAEKILEKYGRRRTLEDSICLEDGAVCVSIQDQISFDGDRYSFQRAVVYREMQYTTMDLKLPESEFHVSFYKVSIVLQAYERCITRPGNATCLLAIAKVPLVWNLHYKES